MVLQVGIVGAGIAGLAAAIAQRKAGNEVELFEQSTFKNEVGAAITMTPNGTRVLDSWQFDHKKARAVEAELVDCVNVQTLESFSKADLSQLRKQYGHPMNFYHRVDLHTTLKDMALDPQGEGPTPTLYLGEKVADIDCEAGIITLASGRKVNKDLIIIADGIWSQFPSLVTQTDKSLSRSPRSAFRTLIPMADIYADEDLRKIFDGRPPGFWVPLAQLTAVVMYPCRDGTLLNIALLHNTLPGNEDKTDWHDTATHEEVFSVLDGFNPLVLKLLSKADSFEVHKLMKRDLLETFVRGRAVLVGDAAHWMFPTHAQGAVLGVEEAAVIALMTKDIASEEVPKRLVQYDELTVDRAHATQILSNFGPRDLAQQKSKRPLYPEHAGPFGPEMSEYFYSFDAVAEAKEYLQKQQSNRH